jgi:hypothetical protein
MKRKKKITILAACILYGLILSPPDAQAALVTIQIEAVVDSVMDDGGYLEGRIEPGDIMTGFYTYDSSVARLPGERYEFDSPPSGVFLSVGGFDFQTDQSNVYFEMGIGNDLSWGDTYYFISFNNLALSNGTPVNYISWQLDDPSGNALSTDALPITSPVLEDWEGNRLRLEADRTYFIDAHVISVIPEPATIILLTIGGLFLRKRR